MGKINTIPEEKIADAQELHRAAASRASARMLAHCLAHGAWTLVFSTTALYYLSHAESTSDINRWGIRLLSVFVLALVGSLCIQLSWWGTQQLGTVKFWGSWLAVMTICNLVVIPIVMQLIY